MCATKNVITSACAAAGMRTALSRMISPIIDPPAARRADISHGTQ
jgi:hypothetical protein